MAAEAGPQAVRFAIDFESLPSLREPLFGYIQLGLKTAAGAVINVGGLAVDQSLVNPDYRPLRIRFDPFGDETKASSRLRVWRFVELLKQQGHTVLIGGADYDVDLYIAQKNRPFNVVKAVRAKNPAAVIVYDFDDNYTLPEEGVLNEFVAFINLVDLVTCGSEHLAEAARRWHHNVYVLENPVDVADDQLARRPRGRMRRVGWFGAPEGLGEVLKAGIERPIETVTKGGDIEFNIATVDQELTGFDLLVFPLEPTPWNLAKNANRMMKALGLGVPVLVSPTPEHSRIHALAELPAECLVTDGDWNGALERADAAFKAIETATAPARQIIWRSYSPRAILSDLFAHLARTTRLGGGLVRRPRAASPALGRTAVLMVDTAPEDLITATVAGSNVDWTSFREIAVCSARKSANQPLAFMGERLFRSDGDFFGAYRDADRFVASTSAEHILVMPPGVCLAHGAVEVLEQLATPEAPPVALLTYSEYFSAAAKGLFTALPLRELLLNPAPLGPLLVRTDWVRAQGVAWTGVMDLWTWVLATRALAAGTAFAVESLPLAFEGAARGRTTPSRNLFYWFQENDPATARELPDLEAQWRRIVVDVVSQSAAGVQQELPAVVGQMHAELLALRRQLEKTQNELKAATKKK